MTIRRFTGPTMQHALRQVKSVLGPEAVILETGEADGQATVTAAVDVERRVERAAERAPARAADAELMAEVRELLGVVRYLVGDQWQGRRRRRRPEPVRL